MAKPAAIAKIKLQYFRSKICTPTKHKLVIKGLGFALRQPGFNPATRQPVARRAHLVVAPRRRQFFQLHPQARHLGDQLRVGGPLRPQRRPPIPRWRVPLPVRWLTTGSA